MEFLVYITIPIIYHQHSSHSTLKSKYVSSFALLPWFHQFCKDAVRIAALAFASESRNWKDVTGRLMQRFIVSVFVYIMHILVYREYFILLPRYEHL
jgi:hypothetical protein